MHTAILLLVAYASNFLVWASPTAVIEPTTQAGVQHYPREEFNHPSEAAWAGQGHQPRDLGKRWLTQTDRRVLAITISEAVAATLGIANTYSFVFQYHFDGGLNRVVYDYDSNRFLMSWPQPLVVGSFDNGRDLAVPAIVTAAANVADALLCTLVWGVRLRTDWVSVVGMGLFELSVVVGGVHLRLNPAWYSWQFSAQP